MNTRIAIIGAGNMAQALLGGLIERGHPPEMLVAADPDEDCRALVQKRFGIQCEAENAAAATSASVVILAVKPQVIDGVVDSLSTVLDPQCVVTSIAAGIPIARLAAHLPESQPIARVMPNTPALLGAGASGLYCAPQCSAEQRALLTEVFSSVGKVVEVDDEALIDVITAVSGSGPAYFFALAEAMTAAGTRAGLSAEAAALLAQQTAYGAGRMLVDADASATELRRRVTSPGGTTAAALDVFSKQHFDALIDDAVCAAINRGRALGAN